MLKSNKTHRLRSANQNEKTYKKKPCNQKSTAGVYWSLLLATQWSSALKSGQLLQNRSKSMEELLHGKNPIMAGHPSGWHASDHTQCHHSPLRRSLPPKPSLPPPPSHSLASVAPFPCLSLCRSGEAWWPGGTKRDAWDQSELQVLADKFSFRDCKH